MPKNNDGDIYTRIGPLKGQHMLTVLLPMLSLMAASNLLIHFAISLALSWSFRSWNISVVFFKKSQISITVSVPVDAGISLPFLLGKYMGDCFVFVLLPATAINTVRFCWDVCGWDL